MNVKTRQGVYLLGTIASGVIGLLLLFGGISSDNADSLNQLIAGLGTLLGTGAAGTAGVVLTRQTKEAANTAPADVAIAAIQQTVDAVTVATTELDKVKEVASNLGGVVLGPLSQQVIDSVVK